jgi:methyl-accepting chemotaxis protein
MNMKIGTRILAGYLAALIIFGIVGLIAYRAVEELVEGNGRVSHSYQVKNALSEILVAMVNAETGQRGFLLTGDQRFLEPFQAGDRDAQRYYQQVRTLVSDNPRQEARLTQVYPMMMQRLASLRTLIEARRSEGIKAIDSASVDSGKREMDDLRRAIGEMDGDENALLEERQASSRQSAGFAKSSILLGGIIAALLTIILSFVIKRSITGPLETFMNFAQRVGEGDLTQRATLATKDELGALSGYLDRMSRGLREVAKQSATVSEDLNAAISEILASTQQQAASTAEQAAAVQQANVTMAELSQSGAQISDRAKQVAAAAEAVSSASASGLQSVQGTTATMEGIREQAETVAENVIALSEKTQAVGEIITSVNEISEESHLLALNAAIQAAVAGEQGRSFAVVASEMKNLAAQSKQATVQVRAILGDIQRGINTSVMLTEEAVKRAEAGKQQANNADRTIRRLSENLEESIRAFQQIVAGSAQQQIGFEQVTQAFRNIGIAVQETASSTRQSEKATANLNALSQQLRDTVRRYRV